MSKRLLILIFTIFLGFIISFSTNTIYASEVESAVVESYSEEYFSNVNQSVELREQVLNPYIVGKLNIMEKNLRFIAMTLQEFI